MSTADGQKFIEEALLMREFDHPNILRLIGVSIDRKEKDMPLVILPFMKHGDLLSYIRNEKHVSFRAEVGYWISNVSVSSIWHILNQSPTGITLNRFGGDCYQYIHLV